MKVRPRRVAVDWTQEGSLRGTAAVYAFAKRAERFFGQRSVDPLQPIGRSPHGLPCDGLGIGLALLCYNRSAPGRE